MKTLLALLLAGVLATGSTASVSKPVRVIRSVFGSGSLGETMICIARRESHLRPWAANWRDSNGGSFGLFQINGIWRRPGETPWHFAHRMFDPWANAREARALYRTRGLEPWGGRC